MYIIGISAFYHDSAACLIKDGEIISAAQEERFSRKKNDPSFPFNSIKYCLKQAKLTPDQITNVVFYEKPFLKFERLLETYLAFAPRGFNSFRNSMPSWIKDKLFQKSRLVDDLGSLLGKNIDWRSKLLFSEHHLSHAASAFFPSPFSDAAILVIDGVGEWSTTSLFIGRNNQIEPVKEIQFPHSLGLLYSAFTYYLGFKVNCDEYKVMGLAPYGKPKYVKLIKQSLISINEDGSFFLNMRYFNYCTGVTMTNKNFNSVFGMQVRDKNEKLTEFHMDIAASIQKVTEEIVIKIAKNISKETGQKNLCFAGGVALNCVANGCLQRERLFENIWIQPAAGDAGGAIGAALVGWHLNHSRKRIVNKKKDRMKGALLGPSYSNDKIESYLKKVGATYYKLKTNDLISKVAESISEGKAIGWMQGRMEFGPRALGSRSILGDPRSALTQKQLNLKIKYRESFRPFAPSVLQDSFEDWFETEYESPYMLQVAFVRKEKRYILSAKQKKAKGLAQLDVVRSEIPAVTHVDFSARLQTVLKNENNRYYKLIKKFEELTNCPMLVNTSFNVRGEPIVCSPLDAYRCFMQTNLDVLAIGDFLLFKDEQFS